MVAGYLLYDFEVCDSQQESKPVRPGELRVWKPLRTWGLHRRNNLAWWPRGTVLAAPTAAGQAEQGSNAEVRSRYERKIKYSHSISSPWLHAPTA
jgi:hypothetical protein